MEYHRAPTPGKISIAPTKGLTNQHDLSLAYSPGVALRLPCHPRQSAGGGGADVTRQSGCRRDERHGGAGARQHRAAGRQAGDGGQGLPVQEVRRHRRVRHRDRRDRPGQDRRDRCGAGADLRRHQPRGHQGAGVLHRRAQAARAHEDPGLPRRPARHRHHRRGGGPQRLEARRQGYRQGDASRYRAPVRRRSPASICWWRLGLKRENVFVCDIKGVVYKGRTEEMDPEKARYAQDTKARTLAEIIAGCRHIPRSFGRRRAEAGDDRRAWRPSR